MDDDEGEEAFMKAARWRDNIELYSVVVRKPAEAIPSDEKQVGAIKAKKSRLTRR